MNSYKAAALSRNDIRCYVRRIKELTGLTNELYFPIIPFLEHILPILIPDFQLEILPKSDMGTKHGETIPSKNLIRIPLQVETRFPIPTKRLERSEELRYCKNLIKKQVRLYPKKPTQAPLIF